MIDLTSSLGAFPLRTPLVAASGTVGAVHDFAAVGALHAYGAAVAKSVSPVPWPGRPPPRLAPAGTGMLNAIGIQNPGIDEWRAEASAKISDLAVPVWGSAVAESPEGYATVAEGLAQAGVAAVEVNLSCPNLETGTMFALDPATAAEAVVAVRSAVSLPIGAKLSPNASDIAAVAAAVMEAGADWLVLTNTAFGAGIDVETRRPLLAAVSGGYSGPPLKPIALRCVWEVRRVLGEVPIVGCGGVSSAADVVEYLLAGASAVAIGTAHFAEPRVGGKIKRDLERYCSRHGIRRVRELIGGMEGWTS